MAIWYEPLSIVPTNEGLSIIQCLASPIDLQKKVLVLVSLFNQNCRGNIQMQAIMMSI
jgi:hypothetical protein